MSSLQCDQVRESLDTYIEGETDPDISQAIAEHVRACPACQEEMTKTTIVMSNLWRERKARSKEKSSLDIWNEVQQETRESLKSKTRARRVILWLTVAAALCFAIGAIQAILGSKGERPPKEPIETSTSR